MPRTKEQALKQKRELQRKYPELRVQLIDDSSKFPRSSSMRYNFRFKRK